VNAIDTQVQAFIYEITIAMNTSSFKHEHPNGKD